MTVGAVCAVANERNQFNRTPSNRFKKSDNLWLKGNSMKFKIIFSLVLAMVSASVLASPEDRVFEQTLEIDGQKRVLIDGGVGTIDVRASDDQKIHIFLKVEPDDDSNSLDEEDMAAMELDVDRTSRRIKLELDLPSGVDVDDVQEEWEVRIPQGVETELELGVGQVDVAGITGGLLISVGVGELNVDIPSGPVEVSVGVGDVEIIQTNANVGTVRVDTTVGDARLRINGERIEGSSHFGIGNRIKFEGEGQDEIEVSVKVGEVKVELDSQ